ncbi:MAG: hypothetical protein CVV02_05740 [Firmicutes bacterium HGW-Firmicutes-7]|nr:MAG: hypothetical protein CVV02_05740 [Firmicutes bacterium HGW-Firmicutes-7]
MDSIGGNSLVIKEININYVRNTLKEKETATKQQIAKATGLSIVTVSTVLQLLVKEKEVFETALISSNGGRPAREFKYNFNYAYVLTLFPYEMNGDIIIHAEVLNLSGNFVDQINLTVERVDLNSFKKIITLLLKRYKQIKSIGFGLPAFESNGKLIFSDYSELTGISITHHFNQLFDLPVIMENDVNCAILGFNKRKNIALNGTLIYLYFPDQHPPGAGISINGEVFKGKDNFAGEVASMPLGITWDKNLYESFDGFCHAVSKLIIAISSLLNPGYIVINGSFLTMEHIHAISAISKKGLPPNVAPNILLSDNFTADYQIGLSMQTLMLLEPPIKLTTNY